ncbi:MAG TPA: rhomboid family intramembrane serine protease [Solirubrobacteraceae bacterium]|jgi:membrane associated rhomboid family serine protease|nr:rhomboid family intramembrane serine protease [Solirubrobacteraceae bacterium]
MTDSTPNRPGSRLLERTETPRQGLVVLAGIVLFMWLIEAINTIDSNHLDRDGIYARNISRLWGILTSPFIHASFQHLFDNTVPFVFLGAIIALHGARRLLLVTGFIIVIGGLGTWLFSSSSGDTIGASGIVFGYAAYLLARGFFDRSIWELGVGLIVGVVWGAVLISSLVPHSGISWQAHLFGGIAGVIVAWRLSRTDHRHDAERQTVEASAR